MGTDNAMVMLVRNTGKVTVQVHAAGCAMLNSKKHGDTVTAYEAGMAEEIEAEQGLKVKFCKCCKEVK